MHLTATYEITAAELSRASRTAFAGRLQFHWAASTLFLALGALEIWRMRPIIIGVITLTAGLTVVLRLTLGHRRALTQRMATLRGPAEVTVTEESVSIRRPGLQSEISWSAALRVKDTDEFILLFQTKYIFSTLLKRGFSPEQQQELSAFIAALPNRDTSDDYAKLTKSA